MQRASSMSRTASMNVGYLGTLSSQPFDMKRKLGDVPLFDDMVETVYRLVFLQALCAAPFAPA